MTNRPPDEAQQNEASENRADLFSSYREQIELAEKDGHTDEASRLRQEFRDALSSWRAQQDLESLAPREVQPDGPSLSEGEVSRLRDLLASTQGLPPSTVSAEGYFLKGNAFYETSDFQSAVNEYSEAIRLNAKEATAYYSRGNAYENMGQIERAVADFDEAIRLNPEYAAAYNNRGNAYGYLRQLERAVTDFDEAIRLNPEYAAAYNNRGNAFGSLGQLDRAVADFDEAIRLNPEDAAAYHGRGNTYGDLGQLDRAVADFDEAIRLDPEDALAYRNRGNAFGDLGQLERAVADYDEAIRLNPEDALAYRNRGNAFGSLGQLERAVADYDEAIRLNPEDATAYYNRGNAYESMGQNERAVADFDEAIRLNPELPLIEQTAGDVMTPLIEDQVITSVGEPKSEEEERVAPVATFIHSDRSAEQDQLGYDLYAKSIVEFMLHEQTQAPLTVGILAPWGQGKTSLMRQVQLLIQNKTGDSGAVSASSGANNSPASSAETPWERVHATFGQLKEWLEDPQALEIQKIEHPTVWFNAWKYQSSEQIWAGLADAVITQLVARIPSGEQRERFWLALQSERVDSNQVRGDVRQMVLARFAGKVRWPALVGLGGIGIAGVGAIVPAIVDGTFAAITSFSGMGAGIITSLGGVLKGWSQWDDSTNEVDNRKLDGVFSRFVQRPEYRDKLGLFHEVESDVKRTLELLVDKDKPAVIFLDDLDRCSPGRVAEVLEAVNLFLSGDFQGCYFIIGMDAQVAAASMEVAHKELVEQLHAMTGRYGSLGWYFMDKFIQLPFVIPNLNPSQSTEYLSDLFAQSTSPHEVEDDAEKEQRDAEALEQIQSMMSDPKIRASELPTIVSPLMVRLRRNKSAEFRRLTHQAIEKGALEFTDDNPEVVRNLKRYGEFLGGNPRMMKRFANMYRFYRLTQWSRELNNLNAGRPSAIGRWIVLMLRWPQLVRWIQWEPGPAAGHYSTPHDKATTFEDELMASVSFEEWMSSLRSQGLDRLASLADLPMYEFLRTTHSLDGSLARATEVGMW